jgi:hypothetical protein
MYPQTYTPLENNMATFEAKSDHNEVITIIEKTSVQPVGSWDATHAKIKGGPRSCEPTITLL